MQVGIRHPKNNTWNRAGVELYSQDLRRKSAGQELFIQPSSNQALSYQERTGRASAKGLMEII